MAWSRQGSCSTLPQGKLLMNIGSILHALVDLNGTSTRSAN